MGKCLRKTVGFKAIQMYLINAYCEPGTLLGTGETKMKNRNGSTPRSLHAIG